MADTRGTRGVTQSHVSTEAYQTMSCTHGLNAAFTLAVYDLTGCDTLCDASLVNRICNSRLLHEDQKRAWLQD